MLPADPTMLMLNMLTRLERLSEKPSEKGKAAFIEGRHYKSEPEFPTALKYSFFQA